MDDFQDQQNEQGQRKKGLVDHVNDMASLYKWGKRARHPIETFNAARGALGAAQAAQGLYGAAAGAEAAAGTAAAGASTPVGWIAIGIGIIIAIIAFIIIFFLKPALSGTDNQQQQTSSTISISASGSANITTLLPPVSGSSAIADQKQQEIVSLLKSKPGLVSTYQQVEGITGVPWQVLAGIHYEEGRLGENKSLVSGSAIGSNEPDIVRAGGCSSTYSPGRPTALPTGGCGFRTFLDSAIYGANHLKAKNGDAIPLNYQALAKSLSYYNGGGNSNCGKTLYAFCPPNFRGEDDSYVMSLFDKKHEVMYLVYCSDLTFCDPPVTRSVPGAMAVILGISKFY